LILSKFSVIVGLGADLWG